MKLNLRDALQHIVSSGGSPGSPEWESQHLSDVVSTMDNIASASLTQMTSSRGDLRLAFQTLDNMEPQNEFQAAMAQYARASLQLLESLGGVTGAAYPETPSTLIPGLGGPSTITDESKVNLLQSLSEYTDSRVTMATYASFPSTPFSNPSSLLRSWSISQTPQDNSPITSEAPSQMSISRPSMSSRHLGHRMSLINSSTLSTPASYDAESHVFPPSSQAYYEPLSEMSSECPTVVPIIKGDSLVVEDGTRSNQDNLVEEVDPGESHDQNTALCKALALQALTDLNISSKLSSEKAFPKLRPLGGSSSFRHRKKPTRPTVRRHRSLNGDPLYMPYQVRLPLSTVTPSPNILPPKLPAPHVSKNPVPPRKPARQFSTKSTRRSCTTLDSVKALEIHQGMSTRSFDSVNVRKPSRTFKAEGAKAEASHEPSTSKHFSFIDKTRSLINRARFGSRNNRKKESANNSLKIDPTKDKSKTL